MYYAQCETCKKTVFFLRKCSICGSWICDDCFVSTAQAGYTWHGICGKCYRMSQVTHFSEGIIKKDQWVVPVSK